MPRNKKAKPKGQSRAKTAADEAYNARRRAKRAAARIEREAEKQGFTGKRAIATKNYVENLRRQIEQSYTSKGYSSEVVASTIRKLDVQTVQKGTHTAAQRRNIITEREIALASQGEQSTIAATPEEGKAAVKIFYKATQRVWEGLPPQDRNRAIMAALGTDNLEDAMNMILAQNQDAYKKALSNLKPIESTDEAAFMEEPGEEEDQGSPPYLAFVNTVEAARSQG